MDIKIIGKDELDYTSAAAFNDSISPHIGHRECEMLLQNMADVGHPKQDIKDLGAKYGFTIDDSAWENRTPHKVISDRIKPKLGALNGEWDDDTFQNYKKNALHERMINPEKNYTFILVQEQGETIGIASFNAPENKSQLRVLNVTVHRDHRNRSTEIINILSREVMRYAMENGFENAPINAPVSPHSVEKGNNKAYRRLAERYGVSMPDKDKVEPDQHVLTFTPCDIAALKPLDVGYGERVNRRRERAAQQGNEKS